MSKNINSFLTSIILYCLISYLLELPYLLTGLLFTIIGSQLELLLPRNYKQSIIIIIPIMAFSIIYPIIGIPVIIGYISSIITALVSKNGCKLLYPYSTITFTGPSNYLEHGGKEETSATVFLLVLSIIAIILSLYGTQILDDVNTNTGIQNYYTNRNSLSQNNYEYNRYTNNSGYIHYVYINPSSIENNRNITTYNYNNTTTTIITEYTQPT
ncbi:hypothetical protein [Methanosphaera sp. WGK6]|uniref:hypothetical protein n=1 Tax=Methanosphaera sp. WGK6 TaxID=1561964 RepID=UPI00084C6BBA|nr:hypothetical protein [Methanosphaera sp. WGK6]OED29922.1 hypothetical protein NL43_05810 [Methanosphaera sp. WGK6]